MLHAITTQLDAKLARLAGQAQGGRGKNVNQTVNEAPGANTSTSDLDTRGVEILARFQRMLDDLD